MTDYDVKCTDGVFELCGDCKHQIQCIDGKAYGYLCTDDTPFCDDAFSDDNVPVCVNQETGKCPACPFSGDSPVVQDGINTEAFMYCNAEDELVSVSCPKDVDFNEETLECPVTEDVVDPSVATCEKAGAITTPNDCQNYFLCIQGDSELAQIPMECADGKWYSVAKEECVDKCDFAAGGFTCTEQGRFSNPANCQEYIECVNDDAGGFKITARRCPDGYLWSTKKGDENGKVQCTPEHMATCEVPPEHNCGEPTGCESAPPPPSKSSFKVLF